MNFLAVLSEALEFVPDETPAGSPEIWDIFHLLLRNYSGPTGRPGSKMGDMQYLTVTPEDRITIGETGGSVFTLKNPTTVNAVYKIKFTAPDRAIIRPCAGFVGPMDEVEVVVTDTTSHPHAPSSPDDETKLRYVHFLFQSKIPCNLLHSCTISCK